MNGYAILTDDATSKKLEKKSNHDTAEQQTKESNSVSSTATSDKFVPAYVALDRTVLRFYAKFTENLHESAMESTRERKIVFRLYVEDFTFDATEPREENSGLQQGLYLKRSKCRDLFNNNYNKRNGENDDEDDVGNDDDDDDESVKKNVLELLRVGNEITLCGRKFTIYACDGFTREFYKDEEISMPENDENATPSNKTKKIINNVNELTYTRAKGPPSARMDDMARFTEAKLGRPSSALGPDTRKKFLEHDGEVLRFYATWNDAMSAENNGLDKDGKRRVFYVHYFLADDSIEVVEKAGRALLRRGKLPKASGGSIDSDKAIKPLDYSMSSIGNGEKIPYVDASEIIIGQTVDVYGREMFVYGCDLSTEKWYAEVHGSEAIANIDISQPKAPKPSKKVPKHQGLAIGSEEDTLQNCLALNPKPPKKDYRKAFEKTGCVLRFEARIVGKNGHIGIDTTTTATKTKQNSIIIPNGDEFNAENEYQRNFILSFFLEDDTASVFEPPAKNGGNGGKFLERKKIKDENGKPYGIDDMFVGNVLKLHKRCFKLIAADDFTLKTLSLPKEI